MMVKACALCGEKFEYTKKDRNYMNAYLERGISKKHFLCRSCYEKKVTILDFAGDKEKREEAITNIYNILENRPQMVHDIVNVWIEEGGKNYYYDGDDLKYFVDGPEACLFVFEDHLTILSNFEPEEKGYDMDDRALIYKSNVTVRETKDAREVKNYFAYLGTRQLSDRDKIVGAGNLGRYEIYDCWTPEEYAATIELNRSFGDYGTLDFLSRDFTFKFYYHQNRLMEEIYLYILQCMKNM